MSATYLFALLSLLVAVPSTAEDYCGFLGQSQAVGANPTNATAEHILQVLAEIAPFNPSSILLRDLRNPALHIQGAAAQTCNAYQRFIFYDPDFVEQIRSKG